MASKKDPEAKFHGRFLFSLRSSKIKKDCYGKAAMIISTLLGIDHKVAEQLAADSGRTAMDISVYDLRKLQLVKICLNKAGVFVPGNELDTTRYLRLNESSAVPDLVSNDEVAHEAYYEAYKSFRSTYADMFHIAVPQVNDIEEEDRINCQRPGENQEQEATKETKNIVIDALVCDIKSHFQAPLSPAEIDRAKRYFLAFRARLIIAELMKLDPSDPLFNLLDQKLHGSKDQRTQGDR